MAKALQTAAVLPPQEAGKLPAAVALAALGDPAWSPAPNAGDAFRRSYAYEYDGL
jgi:hypothetical protein